MPTKCRFPDTYRPFFTSRPGLTALLLIFGWGLFILTTFSVLNRSLLIAYDPPVSDYFSAGGPSWLPKNEDVSIWFANSGTIIPALVSLVFVFLFLRRKCHDRLILLLASNGLAMLLFVLLSITIDRERPALPGLLEDVPFASYPSGHVIQTLTILAPLLYLYLPRVRSTSYRTGILLAAFVYLAAVALNRLIVNAHYLTDVLAGLGIGTGWAVSMLLLFEHFHLRSDIEWQFSGEEESA